MKKIIIAAAILFSMMANAQKDELKTLKKIYSKETPTPDDMTEYKSALAKLEPLASEEADKVYLKYYKAVLPVKEMFATGAATNQNQLKKLFTPQAISEIAAGYRAMLDYEKKTGKKVLTDDINKSIAIVSPILVNMAMNLSSAKKDSEAATVLYAVYQLDNTKQDNLFYAASYAVNGQDFDKALQYYQELKTLNYSGEGMLYYAMNKSTREEEYFNSKNQRDEFIRLKTHEKPRDEKIESKRGQIYKNIALILVNKGKNEEAKQAFNDARKANPDDTSLLINEANLYLTLKDYDTYTKLVNEALQKEPNNHELLFNLGVLSADANKLDTAEAYYKKAIEIKPDYFNAYLNLSELKLRSDKKLVEEINKLGTSDKELKRYEVLNAERKKNFTTILPLIEKAVELKPDNEDAKKTLMSIYNALEMTDKYKALKATMKKE